MAEHHVSILAVSLELVAKAQFLYVNAYDHSIPYIWRPTLELFVHEFPALICANLDPSMSTSAPTRSDGLSSDPTKPPTADSLNTIVAAVAETPAPDAYVEGGHEPRS